MQFTAHHKGSESLYIQLKDAFTVGDKSEYAKLIQLVSESLAETCVLDCSALTYVDSSALGMLVLLKDTIYKNGNKLVTINTQGQVDSSLKLTCLDKVLNVTFTEKESAA